MSRTTAAQVEALVNVTGVDAAARAALLETPMAVAAALLAGVGAKCQALLAQSDDTLELIERYLAAHYYAIGPNGKQQGRLVKSDQVGEGVGRSWVAPTGTKGYGLQSTALGQTALQLDASGCLAAHDAKAVAPRRAGQLVWLGKD